MKKKIHFIGFLLMALGVVMFIGFTEKKKEDSILSKTYRANNQTSIDSLLLVKGASYIVAFNAEHEAGGGFSEWPNVKAQIKISNKKEQLFTEILEHSENREVGGLRRAQDYTEFKYTAQDEETLQIETVLFEGDKMSLEVYQNLSDIGNMLPGLGIIVMLVGVFVYLKYRPKTGVVKN